MVEIFKEIDDSVIKKVVRAIDNGGVVCFPTETVYALVADAAQDEAVNKIYQIKQRSLNKPLSILVSDTKQANRIVHFDSRSQKLSLKFYPGPLTMVMRTKDNNNLSTLINKGLGTVGIRIPSHILSLKIIKAVGRPIIGTSANISGESNKAIYPDDIIETIGDKLDIMIDTGKTELGMESTIIDLSSPNSFKIIREGAIRKEDIIAELQETEVNG